MSNNIQKNTIVRNIVIILVIVVAMALMIGFVLLSHEQATDMDVIDYSNSIPDGFVVNNSSANSLDNDPDVNYNPNKNYASLTELLNSYNIILRQEYNKDNGEYFIYTIFPKDLINDDGSNNQAYFEDVIHKTANYIDKEKFEIYDQEKKVSINVTKDSETKELTYNINDVEDYFDKFNIDKYKQAKDTKIVPKESMSLPLNTIGNLYSYDMMIDRKYLGNPEYSYGKYVYYKNGTLKAFVQNGTILNMVLLKGYEEEIFSGIKVGTSLEEIANKYPNYAFGGISKGYLGYRTGEVYVFFYNDEVSIWQYTYREQEKFEMIVIDYFEDGNLENFAQKLANLWQGYASYDYKNEDGMKYLHAEYPTIGINIDINGSDARFDIYSNYYITERIAKYIADGRMILHEQDAIDNAESNRRINESSELNEEYYEFRNEYIKYSNDVEEGSNENIETIIIN